MRIVFAFVTTALLACGESTQISPDAAPAPDGTLPVDAGPGPCELLHARAGSLLEQEQAASSFPGLAFGLSTPACGVWLDGAGEVILEPPTPMDPDRIMTISSVTKSFVAVVVLQLAEEGALSLDDPVATWRPSLPSADVMTVRHLLHMTSGLRDHWVNGCGGATHDQLVECVAGAGLKFAPGSGYAYSNTGYVLLGLIVEDVTGRPLHDEIRERILEPLELQDTGFIGDPIPPHRVMHTYAGTVDVTGQEDPFRTWGCADMVADLDDLLVFLRALFESDLLAPVSREQMTDFIPTDGFPPGTYGLGLIGGVIEDAQGDPLYTLWGNGGRGDAMTDAFYVPELRAAAVLFVNHRYNAQNILKPAEIFARMMSELGPLVPAETGE